jgi:ketosteroid isomerase-like protein
MSRQNVEIVRRGFMATLEEDWATALETVDPEAEIRDFDVPDGGIYHGHDGFLAWLARWNEGWDSWRIEDLEFRPAPDDQVIALFKMLARGGQSGLEVERSDAVAYRVKGGRIARIEYFNDQQQALEAVGLRD